MTPKTLVSYRCAFNAFHHALQSKDTILERVVELSGRGVSNISINTYLRHVNVYLRWVHTEHGKELIRIPKLKEEQKVLGTFSPSQIHHLMSFHPTGLNQRRVHTLACLLLDTGLRINEARRIQPTDVDLDNMVVKVMGKGGKERIVPISMEGRRMLYRYMRDHGTTKNKDTFSQSGYVFGTRNGTPCSVRNLQRDFTILCGRVGGMEGVRCSFHTLRHTFAVSYLRAGGNLYYLQRILGHRSITTTERYLQSLGISDIQRVHDGLTPLHHHQ